MKHFLIIILFEHFSYIVINENLVNIIKFDHSLKLNLVIEQFLDIKIFEQFLNIILFKH